MVTLARRTLDRQAGIDVYPVGDGALMPAEVADWIQAEVLPKIYTESGWLARLCSCQWGICGACERGTHDRCLTGRARLEGRLQHTSDEGSITTWRGFVIRNWAVLWRAEGPPCRYICPCPQNHLAAVSLPPANGLPFALPRRGEPASPRAPRPRAAQTSSPRPAVRPPVDQPADLLSLLEDQT